MPVLMKHSKQEDKCSILQSITLHTLKFWPELLVQSSWAIEMPFALLSKNLGKRPHKIGSTPAGKVDHEARHNVSQTVDADNAIIGH